MMALYLIEKEYVFDAKDKKLKTPLTPPDWQGKGIELVTHFLPHSEYNGDDPVGHMETLKASEGGCFHAILVKKA